MTTESMAAGNIAAGNIATGNDSAFLYKLLVSPEFRWVRYLVLIMVLGTISFNQVFILFMDYREILGAWIYIFTFIYLLTYVAVVCLNLFWLFPKFLLKRRYLAYSFLLSAAMVIALLIQMIVEYGLFSLAGTPCTGGLLFSPHDNGLYLFFYTVDALHDRRNDDRAPERMDDRPSARLANGESPRAFRSGATERTSQPGTPLQDLASFGRTDIKRAG